MDVLTVKRSLHKTKRWISVTILLTIFAGAAAYEYQKRSLESVFGAMPEVSSGPWGDLQTWRIYLEQPSEYIAFEQTKWDGPYWNFGPMDSQQVHASLVQSGCDADQAEKLIAARLALPGDDFIVNPSDEMVLGLGVETRSKLYLLLARNKKNPSQASPALIPDEGLQQFLGGKVSKDAIELTKKLCYQRNGFTYFSDREIVGRKACKTDIEREVFRRAISASPVFMARLLVKSHADVESAIMYWGMTMPGVYVKDLRPLFEAQKQLRGGGSVSLLYVLPPEARARLYTTPLPPQNGERLPDCHFTALNFFNDKPDPRMSDLKFASQFIMDNYYEVGAPSVAGDLIILLNAQGEAVHSATYLAADLVYTKNGINLGQPWVLMRQRDMIGAFSAVDPVRVAYFRSKQR